MAYYSRASGFALMTLLMTLPCMKAAFSQAKHGAYERQAAGNLSDWRSHILEHTLRQSAEAARQRLAAGVTNVKDQPGDPIAQEALFNFAPILSCRNGAPVERIGGEKFICNIHELTQPCLIFSIGSFNDYAFEEAVLEQTPCSIHTYDCTVEGHSVNLDRHFYHKLCVGSESQASSDDRFVTISQAVSAIGATRLDFLKMDIEAFEWDVISGWRESDLFLPDQVSFELHRSDVSPVSWPLHINKVQASSSDPLHWQGAHAMSIAHISLLFMHLANLGYGVVAKELNGLCCAEFTVLRVSPAHRTRHQVAGVRVRKGMNVPNL